MSGPGIEKSRRAFLFGAKPARDITQRPPWSLAEQAFAAACTGCGACIDACPEGILVSGPDKLPSVDFNKGQQVCTFCGACADVCPEPAFNDAAARVTQPPWSWRALIDDACLTRQGVMCQSCKDACGDGAIHFAYGASRVAAPQIDLSRCTGCGACAAPCPAGAITFQWLEAAGV